MMSYIENKIAKSDNPRRFGKSLTGNLKGLWRYRVGDYRIICQIDDAGLIILVIEVGHRRKMYH